MHSTYRPSSAGLPLSSLLCPAAPHPQSLCTPLRLPPGQGLISCPDLSQLEAEAARKAVTPPTSARPPRSPLQNGRAWAASPESPGEALKTPSAGSGQHLLDAPHFLVLNLGPSTGSTTKHFQAEEPRTTCRSQQPCSLTDNARLTVRVWSVANRINLASIALRIAQ